MDALWENYTDGTRGEETENELVRQYLPLVRTVVGRMAMSLPQHVDNEDLHSAGLIGLLNALRRYDPHSGVAFESYARIRIRGAVLDELRRLDWAPRSVHAKARKVQETMRRIEQERGEIPSDSDMAESMGMSLEEYQNLLEEIRPATFVFLDATRSENPEEGATHHEFVPDARQPVPGEQAVLDELKELIRKRLEMLPDMQRKVLAFYYFEDLRLREIAEIFQVTESRICQIHSQAILAIKSFLRRHEMGLA